MIDWARVKELKEEMDTAFDEVVSLFLEETDETMGRLPPADAEGPRDSAALAADLHALKGAALNLGLRDFADLCSKGEAQSAAGAADEVDLAGIMACYRASRDAFIRGLNRDAA